MPKYAAAVRFLLSFRRNRSPSFRRPPTGSVHLVPWASRYRPEPEAQPGKRKRPFRPDRAQPLGGAWTGATGGCACAVAVAALPVRRARTGGTDASTLARAHGLPFSRRRRPCSHLDPQRRPPRRDAAGLSFIRRDLHRPELSLWEVCPPSTPTMPQILHLRQFPVVSWQNCRRWHFIRWWWYWWHYSVCQMGFAFPDKCRENHTLFRQTL